MPSTPGGIGVLRFQPGEAPTLSWQSPLDEAAGTPQSLGIPGVYRLPSGSDETSTSERWLEVRVDPALLPPVPVEERLLVELAERACLSWTVRNVRLVETGAASGEGGVNDVFVWFAEAPLGRQDRPGLFRLAHVPVEYHPETGRDPSAPLVEVQDQEFASIGE